MVLWSEGLVIKDANSRLEAALQGGKQDMVQQLCEYQELMNEKLAQDTVSLYYGLSSAYGGLMHPGPDYSSILSSFGFSGKAPVSHQLISSSKAEFMRKMEAINRKLVTVESSHVLPK
ncbi:Keratin, type II cytoskeletal 8 [Galemys pyrenaicus]|uniref:Keratin, type II cytoskeletal 8 n=1 Tax=Galemys pyrenaicus TaxID=202257 RepID=A0A8J6ATZ5_GALPY|nr:Keratin, type II cytoskeletal 8 [Galemys pyrenaicus]